MIDRVTWLGMLAKLGTPADPVKAFGAMEAYLPFLADVPAEAFTKASLEAAAMAPKRLHIPDLSEVKGPLLAWWRENKPHRTALPAPPPEPERAPPTAEEREAVRQALAKFRSERSAAEPVVVPIRARHLAPEQLAQLRQGRG